MFHLQLQFMLAVMNGKVFLHEWPGESDVKMQHLNTR